MKYIIELLINHILVNVQNFFNIYLQLIDHKFQAFPVEIYVLLD